MAYFMEAKGSRIVKEGRLYEKGSEISLEADVSQLVLAINSHPLVYTEASCQGHFGPFLNQGILKFVIVGGKLLLEQTTIPFEEAYPNVDFRSLGYFYDRGDVCIVTSECHEGEALEQKLRACTNQIGSIAYIEKNDYSESERGLRVVFSPKHNRWVTDISNGWPITRIRQYSFDEILQLNADRLKVIKELQKFFDVAEK